MAIDLQIDEYRPKRYSFHENPRDRAERLRANSFIRIQKSPELVTRSYIVACTFIYLPAIRCLNHRNRATVGGQPETGWFRLSATFDKLKVVGIAPGWRDQTLSKGVKR